MYVDVRMLGLGNAVHGPATILPPTFPRLRMVYASEFSILV